MQDVRGNLSITGELDLLSEQTPCAEIKGKSERYYEWLQAGVRAVSLKQDLNMAASSANLLVSAHSLPGFC